jgi:hypothetical protein
MRKGWRTFSKVSIQVYLLHKDTIENNFQYLCLGLSRGALAARKKDASGSLALPPRNMAPQARHWGSSEEGS